MADRIGAFKNIIPVTSRPNVPPSTEPTPEPPEPGITWSKEAKFKYSTLEVDPLPKGGKTGFSLKGSDEHRYETRVEELPAATMYVTEDYKYTFRDHFPAIPVEFQILEETWREAWFFLGSETQKEIIGYTSNGVGGIVERFKEREVEYWLHLTFKKPTPNLQGVKHKYGELPPVGGGS